MKRSTEIKILGYILFAIAIMIGILGFTNQRELISFGNTWDSLIQEFYANISTEIVSIAVTVLIIDSIYERRDIAREKKTLILQLSSPNYKITQEATRVLRIRGWLTDGSLRNVSLQYANLSEGLLWSSDLQGADFYFAKLLNARLEKSNLFGAKNLIDEQLATARNLRKTIMPNGELYDGRYNLDGDFWLAKNEQVNIEDDIEMVNFYGVSLETYIDGQKWARNNLERVRRNEKNLYNLKHNIPISRSTNSILERLDEKSRSNNRNIFLLGFILLFVEWIKYFKKNRR